MLGAVPDAGRLFEGGLGQRERQSRRLGQSRAETSMLCRLMTAPSFACFFNIRAARR